MNAAQISASRATSAYERMRLPQANAPKARVRSREVGFRLGSFGFTYTARDLEIGAENPAAQPATATVSTPASTLASVRSPARDRAASLEPDTSPENRRRGLRAYSESMAEARAAHRDAVPISTLLTVV